MDFIKESIIQNQHWESGRIEFPRSGPHLIQRDAFPLLERYGESKFITLVRGLRRCGKSVLVRQHLQKMLEKGVQPKSIAWFEFDRQMNTTPDDLDFIIQYFFSRGVRTIVLDEIQFVSQWQDVLKRHYDRTDVKFILTGSSALELDRRSAESMAGRFEQVSLKPFNFGEYLDLKGLKPAHEHETEKNAPQLMRACEEYLAGTGLPEAIPMDGPERKKEYIRSTVMDPLFYKDIPVVFPSAKPDFLLRILELLAPCIGREYTYQSIANVLQCSYPIIAENIGILERSLLVRTAYNYTGSLTKQKRTAKKIIFSDNGIASLFDPALAIGFLAENAVAIHTDAGHFYRDAAGHEVDIILPEKKLAIEVKYQSHIQQDDENGLRHFLGLYPDFRGIVLTKNEKKEGRIRHIPLWRFLLGKE